jgi:hypothetical protein
MSRAAELLVQRRLPPRRRDSSWQQSYSKAGGKAGPSATGLLKCSAVAARPAQQVTESVSESDSEDSEAEHAREVEAGRPPRRAE